MKSKDLTSIKSALHIEEVISRYIGLQRRGRNYVGLCPFHGDKHPSLVVNPEKQTFCCYSCKEWGDVFGFVQKMERCTFGQAVEKLKIENGELKIEKKEKEHVAKPLSILNSQFSINEGFLSALLPYASGHTELSGTYLDFEVGQSPVQLPREWYYLHNRIVFPIRDAEGRLVGFAGRRLQDEKTDEPKYINSSAASGYKKSEVLYGLYRAKEAIQRQDSVFITEGFKDAIAMHAAGFTNTVALCGTALSAFQIDLLKQYTDRVYLLLDGDKAGQEASRRLMPLLAEARMEAEQIRLPEGEDPDSLFRKWGREVFAAMLGRLLTGPHSSESRLLAYCLLYPEATFPFKDTICRFTELLTVVLKTDGLLFEDLHHLSILRHLSAGGTEQTLPASLGQVAEGLHADFDATLFRDEEILEELMPEMANRREVYQSQLLFLYSENRVLRDIRRQVRLLLHLPVTAKEERTRILIYIAGRRELLRHVSECLERPGAIKN